MSDVTLPVIGQEPWGEDLDAYLLDLRERLRSINHDVGVAQQLQIDGLSAQLASLAGQFVNQGTQIATLTGNVSSLSAQVANLSTTVQGLSGQVGTLTARVTTLEARPDYIFGQATYMFSNAAGAATGNQIRINNATPQLATSLDVRRVDADGADRSFALDMIASGSLIRLADYDNAANWYRYKATGPKVKVGADNYSIPVVWHSGAGTVPNSKIAVTMLIAVPPQ